MADGISPSNPLRAIHLRNFKSVSKATVEFAPLTVLVGANSSGKSSILKALVALHQVASTESPIARFALNGPKSSLGYLSEVRNSAASKDDPVEIGVDLCLPALASYGFTTLPWQMYTQLRGNPLPVSYNVKLGPSGTEAEEAASPSISGVELTATTPDVVASVQLKRSSRAQNKAIVATKIASGAFQPTDPHRRFEPFVGQISGKKGRGRVTSAAFVGGVPIQLVGTAAGDQAVDNYIRVLDDLLQRLDTSEVTDGVTKVPKKKREAVIDLIATTMSAWSRDPAPRLPLYRAILEALTKDELTAGVITHHRNEVTRSVRERWHGARSAMFSWETLDAQVIDYASQQLLAFLVNHTFYLAGLRVAPQPLYPLTALATDGDIGTRGENLAATLLTIGDREVISPTPNGTTETKTLMDSVRDWAQHLDLLDDIVPENRGAHGNAIKVRQIGSQTELDVSAVGVGVSQVLPVLVRCLLAEPGQLVLLEQPELHLHPAAQLRLADFLVACVRSGRQIVVETHSEHLVNRLRRRVAEAPPDAPLNDHVSIVFAERDGKTEITTYRPIELNEMGGFEDWPSGFFPEGTDEVRLLLEAGLRKRAAADAP